MAAAAAEAVALARAAAEVAGEVVRMSQTEQRHRPDFVTTHDTEDNYLAREILRAEAGLGARYADACLSEDAGFSSIFSDESEVDDDEQRVQRGAVTAGRQSERSARSVRAARKAAKSCSGRNPVAASSSARKKRLKGCRSPLGCFYKMTGWRLLTAKQEVEFSQGIQVRLTN